MNDIDQLQQRIAAAMARIGQGVEGLAAAQNSADDGLRQELEDERTVNAQLSERVRTLKTRADDDLAALRQQADDELGALRAQVDQSAAQMAQLDRDLQKVRRINDQLREACEALRTANAEGIGDPDLVNRALIAEVEGLRTTRAADVAEANAILSALGPLVDGAAQHQGDPADA